MDEAQQPLHYASVPLVARAPLLLQERERISELLTDNARLEKECQNSFEKSALLEKELDAARTGPGTPRANMGTLQDQLVESERSRMLELQLENTRLRSQLDQSKYAYFYYQR